MEIRTRIIIALLAAVLAAACGTSPQSRFVTAVEAFETGDTARCVREFNSLTADSAAFATLNAAQLCRMAAIYVSLTADRDANDGMAVRCINRARTLSADTVEAFIQAQNGDLAHDLRTIERVGSYLDIPRDSLVGIEDSYTPAGDSLPEMP